MDRRHHYGRRKNSNALWGVLLAAVLAVIAVVFLVNTTGNNATTASKNIPNDTATTGSVAPAPSSTGQSTPR